MLLPKFDLPGFLTDLDAQQSQAWNEFISKALDDASAGFPHECDFDAPRAQFFNQTKTATAADAQEVDITWTAFPRKVKLASVSDIQRWRKADSSRDMQDEYCEWSIERDSQTDKITRVMFTCEGPEYWEFLASVNPGKVLALYQQSIGPAVKASDLFSASGDYNSRNQWNTSTANGAMHLVQRANTLGAEIELAAGSSVVRIVDGRMLTGEQELIECGTYGDPDRHSDPHIGALVNSLTQQKADVTLANPVGIYFAGLTTTGWVTPDGSDAKDLWRYTRGTPEKPVRAELAVPAGKGFVIGDITINGRKIEFGGQVADFINMKLTGIGTRFGQSAVEPMTACRSCHGPQTAVADVGANPSVLEVLKRAKRALGYTGSRSERR